MYSIIILSVFLTRLPLFESYCHGTRATYRAQFLGKLVQDNKVLIGHVFDNFSVQNFTECSGLCNDDCRCKSFNLPMSGQGRCELNDADNTTALLKPLSGSRYHHLEMVEIRQGDDTCWEPYENGCCEANPCEHEATCTEVNDNGKPGFSCDCTNAEGYLGSRCERPIRSCFDYLWANKDSVSGHYNLWDKNAALYRVWCHMQPEKLEAWAAVLVSAFQDNNAMKDKPFYDSYSSNEDDASLTPFRLPLAKMNSIVLGLKEQGFKAEWKTTCYEPVTGSTYPDEVRSSFNTLDLLKLKTDYELVGFYPFNNVTADQDGSEHGNHASFTGISYEDGPLGVKKGSIRMIGSTGSYVRLNNPSGKLDLRKSMTIMLQLNPHSAQIADIMTWGTSGSWGLLIRLYQGYLKFVTYDRYTGVHANTKQATGVGYGMWNHIAVTYDYVKSQKALYVNGTLLSKSDISRHELYTQVTPVTLGTGNSGSFNGRMACLRIFAGALSDEKIAELSDDWGCVAQPDPNCLRVDYINIRNKECYGCSVWARQGGGETFNINADRGDQFCSFKSGSTVANEKLFGFYDARDATTHGCVSSPTARTKYWFGGRL